ncbi:MAG: hypothetical protein ACON5H_04505 [Akkermansiaceae bacterium]
MRLISVLLFAASSALSSADGQLIAEILPKPSETEWQKISWRTDLWEARKEAAKAKKPIYLWEMDGHPLGCV